MHFQEETSSPFSSGYEKKGGKKIIFFVLFRWIFLFELFNKRIWDTPLKRNVCTFPSHRDFDAALLVFIFLSSRFSYSEDFQIGQHIVVCAVKNKKRASKCHPAFLPSQNDLLVKIKSREMNDIKSCQSVESNRWNSTRAVHSTRYVQFPAAIPFGEQDRKFGTWFLSFHIFKLKMWCLN